MQKIIKNIFSLLIALWFATLLFSQIEKVWPPLHFGIALIDLALVLAGIRFFIQFGSGDDIDISIDNTLSPSINFDPSQIGYILDGYVDNHDLLGLLIQWGNQGYIKIHLSKGEIYLIRLKKMDKANLHQQFFAHLFKTNATVSLTKLNQNFSLHMLEASKNVENYFNNNDNRIYYLETLGIQKLLSIFLTLPVMLCVMAVYIRQLDNINFIQIVAILLVSCLIAISATYPVQTLIQALYHWHSMPVKKRILKTSITSAFTFSYLGPFFAYSFNELPYLASLSLLTILLLFLLILFSKKKTPKGKEWFSRIISMKNFIKEVPQEGLKKILTENPNYYFEVLPYAYVMGISTEWSKNYDKANLDLPVCEWFSDGEVHPLSAMDFNQRLIKTLDHITVALTSKPYVKSKY